MASFSSLNLSFNAFRSCSFVLSTWMFCLRASVCCLTTLFSSFISWYFCSKTFNASTVFLSSWFSCWWEEICCLMASFSSSNLSFSAFPSCSFMLSTWIWPFKASIFWVMTSLSCLFSFFWFSICWSRVWPDISLVWLWRLSMRLWRTWFSRRRTSLSRWRTVFSVLRALTVTLGCSW